jgi:phosphatidylinositol alpha-1,6-mannosyltransferase
MISSEFPPQPGGIGSHAYQLCSHLSEKGYEVELISDNRSKTGKEETTFDNKLDFKVHRVSVKSLRILMYFKRVYLLFEKSKKADIILASGKFSLWIVGFYKLFFRKKTVAIIHGSEVNFTNSLLKKSINWSLKRFDLVVAVSNFTGQLVKDLKVRLEVIPNGFNEWKDFKVIENYDIVGDPVLTTVGNVTERKGQENVIKHLPQLLGKYPEIHYHCIGIPTEVERLKQLANELNIQDNVTFHGRLPYNEVYKILLKSDVFVMLSSETKTGDVEGFGIAILEANSLGVPAIGARGCGIEDAIKHGKSGYLVSVDSSEEFESSLENILENKSKFKESAMEWSKKFTWNNIIEKYIKALSI